MKKNTLLHWFQDFIQKKPKITAPSPPHKAEQQLLKTIGIKFAVLFFVILMSDTLVHLFLSLVDFATHIMHLIIEAIEYSLLVILEKLFGFSHKLSEIIIVNTAIMIALFWTYRFIPIIPKRYYRIKQYIRSAWQQYITQKYAYWKQSSFGLKIKALGAYGLGLTCLVLIIS